MADGGRDYDPVNISEADLRNVVFPPFKAAVDAGVGTIMSAYMDLNNTPASANAHTLREILRDEWGFEGFVVSDASAIRNLVTEGYAKGDKDAAGKAFKAGVNMDMSSFSYIRFLGELIREGSVTMEELDMIMDATSSLAKLGVRTMPGHKLLEIRENSILLEDNAGYRIEEACDAVIVALGVRAQDMLEEALKPDMKVFTAGDAKRGGRRIPDAIHEAFQVALLL